jgi:hypothetical protein
MIVFLNDVKELCEKVKNTVQQRIECVIDEVGSKFCTICHPHHCQCTDHISTNGTRRCRTKWKPWKRLKQTVLSSNTEKASRSNPSLNAAPTLTELVDQRAESSSTGQRDQTIQARDLWADALKALSNKDQIAFQAHSDSDLGILERLCALAEQKQDDCGKRGWKFKVNGRQIILRDLAQKIIVWVDIFKEIGDVAANFDPVQCRNTMGGS